MNLHLYKGRFSQQLWKALMGLLGEPPVLAELRESLGEWKRRCQSGEQQLRQLEQELQQQKQELEKTRAELNDTREDRLRWMAKEASMRKEMQDCQERNKELLEKVVGLTQQQREMKQSLLDQKFRSETTPLERTRFEAELAEARARVREAEQRAQRAEEIAARLEPLQREVQKVKEMQERLIWEARRAEMLENALRATVERLRQTEEKLHQAAADRPCASARRPYRKPRIRISRPAEIQAEP